MNKKINYGAIVSVLLAIVLVAGGFWAYSSNSDLKSSLGETSNALVNTQAQNTQLTDSVSQLQNTILELQKPVTPEVPTDTVTPVEEPKKGYLIDELKIGDIVIEKLTDKDMSIFFDGKFDFDDDDYNVDEYLVLNGLNLTVNEKDFSSNVYSVIRKGNIEYRVEFDSKLNKSLISEKMPLVFNFLGSEVEVTKWNGTDNSITIRYGAEQRLNEGESVTVDGKVVTAKMISETHVYFDVDGVGKSIADGKAAKVNGIKISLEEDGIWYSENRVSSVTFRAGDSIKDTFNSEDEYEEDSVWSWNIEGNSIGIVLSEDFRKLNDDEGRNALGAGDKISLPNDYVTIEFNGLSDVDYEDYTFSVYDEENGEATVIKIVGEFEDYDKVYFNLTTGIFSEKSDGSEVIGEPVKLVEGLELTTNGSYFLIGTDTKIAYNLTEIYGDDLVNPLTDDEDYRTVYGIVITNPEDSIDDQSISISVPSEQVEGSFYVY